MADFKNFEDVERWVGEQARGLDDLKIALTTQRFTERSRELGRLYLDKLKDEAAERQRAADEAKAEDARTLQRRATDAVEKSAAAAVESAKHAGTAVMWSRIAAAISLGALVLAALSHIVK